MKKEPKKTKEQIKAKPANQRSFKEKTLLKKAKAKEEGVEVLPVSHDSVNTIPLEKNKGGRPSSFDEAAPKIILSLRNGNTYECAAGVARISYWTFNEWKKRAMKI